MKATSEAKDKLRAVELEVARMRGQAATEVAALKTTARREVEAKKREDEIKFLKYQESHLSRFLKQVSEK